MCGCSSYSHFGCGCCRRSYGLADSAIFWLPIILLGVVALPFAFWRSLTLIIKPDDPSFSSFISGPHGLLLVATACIGVLVRNWLLNRRSSFFGVEEFRRNAVSLVAIAIFSYVAIFHGRIIYFGNREIVVLVTTTVLEWARYACTFLWVQITGGIAIFLFLWRMLEWLLFGAPSYDLLLPGAVKSAGYLGKDSDSDFVYDQPLFDDQFDERVYKVR